MAIKTLFDENEEESNPNKSTSLESGVIGGAAPVVAPGTVAKSTGWTNLQQYLDTNKGAGGAIADAQLGGLNKEIGATKDSINSWATEANKNVDAGVRKDEWSNKVKGASADDINKNLGGANAQAFDAWKRLNDYMGPKDATKDVGYQDVYNKSQNTWGKISNANTLQGQQQLAKDAFGKDASGNIRNYTSGMGALDSFVARGDGQSKFDAFQTGNANFNDNLKSKVSAVDSKIAGAEAIGAANRKSVMDAIAGRIQGIRGEQDTRAAEANKPFEEQAATASKMTFGLNKDFQHGFDPNAYLTKISGLDAATQAEVDALNILGGMDDDASTGSYAKGTKTAGFDMNRFQGDVENKFSTWVNPNPVVPTTPTAGGDDIVSRILNKPLSASPVAAPTTTGNINIDPGALDGEPLPFDSKNGARIDPNIHIGSAGTIQLDPNFWEEDPKKATRRSGGGNGGRTTHQR